MTPAMPAFRIRAQWWGPDGAQVGVADDTVEAEDACDALNAAIPSEDQRRGQFTHATITIALPLMSPEDATGPAQPPKPARMTDAEVMAELVSRNTLNMARQAFSTWSARIEQAGQQRKPLSAIELRRMEFEAVRAIAAVLGVKL